MMEFDIELETQDTDLDLEIEEIGTALTHSHASLTELDFENSGHTGFASINDIPTMISSLQNDVGYITIDEVPEVPEIKVFSVNDKTGDVIITREELGAEEAGMAQIIKEELENSINEHKFDRKNPHKVTLQQLNGVSKTEYNPNEKTLSMDQPIGVDSEGKLWTQSNIPKWKLIAHLELENNYIPEIEEWNSYYDGEIFENLNEITITGIITGATGSSREGPLSICINGENTPVIDYGSQKSGNTRQLYIHFEKVSPYDIFVHSSVRIGSEINQYDSYVDSLQIKAFRLNEKEISSIGFAYPYGTASQGLGAGTDLYIYGK